LGEYTIDAEALLQYLISLLSKYYRALLETNAIPVEMFHLEVKLPEQVRLILKGVIS
jgi:asparagine synthetase A